MRFFQRSSDSASHSPTRRKALRAISLSAATGLVPSFGSAQAGRPLRVIVGFPPGGAVDLVARLYADAMSPILERPVIVDNRSGAGGRIAIEAAKAAAPDGDTMLMTPSALFTIYPHVYKNLKYDGLVDFAPVASACAYPFGFGTGAQVPVATIGEFIAWAKAGGRALSFGSPGPGTGPHLMGLAFARATGIDMTHVAYRGGAQALQDVVAGQIPAIATTLPNLVVPHNAGRVRILAHTGSARLKSLPDIPTFKESGIAALEREEWFGFFLPAKTQPEIVARYGDAIRAAAAEPRVVQGLSKLEFGVLAKAPAEFGSLVRRDLEQWRADVKSLGFTLEELTS
jgi:tripartite-type tricarboxylate transporter receptor subunit TctC